MFTRKRLGKAILVGFLVSQFWGFGLLFPKKLNSANLTDVSDSLSNNRLSFRGELEGAVSAGSGVVNLDTTPEDARNTSTGSASLMTNESLQVGTNNAAITIKTIDSATRVVLSSGVTNTASDGDLVVATSSAIHTVAFTPVSTIASGAFRALIPAADAAAADGYPDKTGFDFSTTTPTVTCTGGGGNMTFETGTASASAITINSTDYHSFECRYTGTGASPAAVTMTIGTPAGGKLINPSPASTTRYPGEADTYTFRVRHLYGTAQSYTYVDESFGKVGVVEAVRVTATVAPILTFQITGIGVSASDPTTCGIGYGSRAAATTYNTAPFGSVTTSAFSNLAQQLLVSTNAAGGYTVTASESAQLTAFNITGTPTIPDTTCDSGCTTTTPTAWTSPTNKGFGYALEDVNGDAVNDSIEYSNGYRPFGTTGVQIMRANPAGPVDSDMAYVCYRIVVSGLQQAGDYENYVIYIATATF